MVGILTWWVQHLVTSLYIQPSVFFFIIPLKLSLPKTKFPYRVYDSYLYSKFDTHSCPLTSILCSSTNQLIKIAVVCTTVHILSLLLQISSLTYKLGLFLQDTMNEQAQVRTTWPKNHKPETPWTPETMIILALPSSPLKKKKIPNSKDQDGVVLRLACHFLLGVLQ